jgi:alkanesulfonate monooxygenase SsuD/methylene tetrahydromethanopterin reductase-like flavin-dependent oxidoreductase (luciferase family)
MTMWERVEALAQRVADIESHGRRLERLERHVEKLERGERPSVPGCQHDCAEQGTHRDCNLHMGRVDAPPPPVPVVALSLHEERMREVCGLLESWLTCRGSLDLDSDLDDLTRAFLARVARARVAPEKP